jgi:type II secretory pathway component GspD/PulD (secretin)/SH3-like domain-containing protein
MMRKPTCLEVVFVSFMLIMIVFASRSMAQNTVPSANQQKPVKAETGQRMTIRVADGRLRKGPSLDAPVVYIFKKGEIVSVVGLNETWYQVELEDGSQGWAHQSLFWKSKAIPTSPAAKQDSDTNAKTPAGTQGPPARSGKFDPPAETSSTEEELITLNLLNVDIREALSAVAVQRKVNIVTAMDVSGNVSVHLYKVTFNRALDGICRAGGFSYHKDRDVYYVFKPKEAIEPLAESLELKIFKLEYADMDKIQSVLEAIPGTRMIKIHDPSKTIIVEDTPENIAKIESLIRYWDIRPKQVIIEAKILEVLLTDEMTLGVDWEKILGDVRIGTGGFSRAILPSTTSISPVPETGAGLFANIITGAGTTHQFAAALDALQEITKINTLSTPKILAIHSKPAMVQVGGKQGYSVTTSNQGVSTESIEFIDTGTILEITPYIDDDNNVLLKVIPSLNSAEIQEGIPVVRTTNVTTWMMAQNGETVFIGGLIQDIEVDTWEGLPCLGEIPGLKLLFGRSFKGINKTELIVLITPRVLEYGTPKDQQPIEETNNMEKHLKNSSSMLWNPREKPAQSETVFTIKQPDPAEKKPSNLEGGPKVKQPTVPPAKAVPPAVPKSGYAPGSAGGITTARVPPTAVIEVPEVETKTPAAARPPVLPPVGAYPYSIHATSHKSTEAAEIDIRQYRQMGLPAFWVKIDLGKKGTWYRVFCGYFKTAEAAQKTIKAKQLRGARPYPCRHANFIGAYSSQRSLEQKRHELTDRGYSPYVIRQDNGMRFLFLGGYTLRRDTEKFASELSAKGIQSTVVKR